VHCKFEFTNFNCTSLDKDFMDVDECFLKSVNRSYKYLNFRTKIHKFPVDRIRVAVLQRLNGYKPFLFNFTVDACKFLKGQRISLTQFFYDLFAPYSNMLHQCPYDHDVYVHKVPIGYLDHRLSDILPLPEGDYCGHSIYSSRGIARLDLKIYFTKS
ncbi:hypothetical protein KR009_006726, partial [Drosophila setifemur]